MDDKFMIEEYTVGADMEPQLTGVGVGGAVRIVERMIARLAEEEPPPREVADDSERVELMIAELAVWIAVAEGNGARAVGGDRFEAGRLAAWKMALHALTCDSALTAPWHRCEHSE
jgi:hypothetical protein